MLTRENFTEEHIRQLQSSSKRDPILIERTVYAFAPHTTGIPLGVGKDMEVMKQLYDVSTLIDEMNNFDEAKKTYHKVVQSEIAYRGILW